MNTINIKYQISNIKYQISNKYINQLFDFYNIKHTDDEIFDCPYIITLNNYSSWIDAVGWCAL